MIRLSRYSVVYVRVPVSAEKDGAKYDSTSDVVYMAFTQGSSVPSPIAASWEPNTSKARILIGPGSTVGALTPGYWDIWCKITDNPEIPFEKVDIVEIY